MKKVISIALALVLTAVLLPIGVPQNANASAPNLNSASTWAREGIIEAVAKGFVPAEIQGNYTNVITRAEFCRMAIRWVEYAAGTNINAVLAAKGLSRDQNAFSDTRDSDILAAYALGITSGAGGGRFAPNGQFNREQAATMIMNTCSAIGIDVSNPPASDFTDMNTAASWAVDGINFVRANGIMSGSGNRFAPKATYTREQSITTFNNIDLVRYGIFDGDLPSEGSSGYDEYGYFDDNIDYEYYGDDPSGIV